MRTAFRFPVAVIARHHDVLQEHLEKVRTTEAMLLDDALERFEIRTINLGGPMSVLMPATLVTAVPVLIGLHRLRRRAGFSLMVVGAGLLAASLVMTLRVNVPIDDAIARWTVDTLPSDWMSIRNRWEAYHAARTFASIAGFGSALAAVLWSREDAARPA